MHEDSLAVDWSNRVCTSVEYLMLHTTGCLSKQNSAAQPVGCAVDVVLNATSHAAGSGIVTGSTIPAKTRSIAIV